MNTYRITFGKGAPRRDQIVKANSVNGFEPTSDSYTFKVGQEVVAVAPKAQVLCVEKIAAD